MFSDMRALPHRVMKTSSKIYERRKEFAMLQKVGEEGREKETGRDREKKIQNVDKQASCGVTLQPGKEGNRFPGKLVFGLFSSSQVGIGSSGHPTGCCFFHQC